MSYLCVFVLDARVIELVGRLKRYGSDTEETIEAYRALGEKWIALAIGVPVNLKHHVNAYLVFPF